MWRIRGSCINQGINGRIFFEIGVSQISQASQQIVPDILKQVVIETNNLKLSGVLKQIAVESLELVDIEIDGCKMGERFEGA